MGFPFLSGYYSKDVILEVAYGRFSLSGHFAFWLGSLAAFFTSFYSMRLLFLTFLGEVNLSRVTVSHSHDAPLLMALPMALLSVPSMFIGYLSRDFFVGLGTPFWANALVFTGPDYGTYLTAEFLPFSIKIVPVVCSSLGTLVAMVYYTFLLQDFQVLARGRGVVFRAVYGFLVKKWYLDKIYNEFIVQHFLSSGYGFSYAALDRGFLELLGPQGAAHNVTRVSSLISSWQVGLPYNHLRIFTISFLYGGLLLLLLSQGVPAEVLFLLAGLLLV